MPHQRDVENGSWRQRLQALRNLRPLLLMLWETHRGFVSAIIAIRALRAAVPLAVLWIGKLIIDWAKTEMDAHRLGVAVHWNSLVVLLAVGLAIAVVGDALARAGTLVESLLGDLFSNRISVRLMEHAATLDLRHYEESKFYDHLERARRQTMGRNALITILLSSIQDFITLVSLSAVLLAYLPWLLALLAVTVFPSFLGETHYASLGYSFLYRWTPERRQLEYLCYTGASNETAKEVKLFGLSRWLIERYAKLANAFYEANKRLAIRRSVVSAFLTTIGTAGYYGAYAVIIYLTVLGRFTIGTLTFLAGSFQQSRDLIQRILLSMSQIYEQSLYLSDLFAFFEMKPTIVSAPHARSVPNPIREGFEFRDVGFRYPGSDVWAVRHLTFRLGPGERLALVGENGAGKTTLTKLLARLYEADEGVILLDGVDLREYDVGSLHRSVGVIFQDFVRYAFLLRENIGVGEIGAVSDRDRIRQAAEQSMAASLAARFPKGYEQMLGRRFEEGIELSGGEWQKVALARAYIREAQVLILDEPTASLDARAEYEIFLRFAELTRNKAAVLISHRFSTVRMADRILVLDKGLPTEQGTHAELVAQGGTYAQLFALQARQYL